MKSKSVLAHAILALGGLVLAYLVWTDDGPVVDESEVTIFECATDTLTRAVIEEGVETVTLEVEREGEEPTVWITVARRPEEGEPTTTRFVGAEEAVTYLEKIAPLRARRSLGRLSAEQTTEVGLAEPAGTLTLHCGERSTAFQLGGRAFGEGDRYLRAGDGGEVWLVGSDRLAPLASAQVQLMQRALHVFEWTEVETLDVRAYGTQRRLRQRNRLDPQMAEWVDAEAPDRRNELYGNWLSRYPRVRVQAYLADGEAPGADLEASAGAPEEVMVVEMLDEGGERLGRMEMQRVAAEPPAFYVRTETTRSWVRVPTSVAQSFADDLRPVLGLEPLPEPTPAAVPDAGVDAGVDAGASEAAPAGAVEAPSPPPAPRAPPRPPSPAVEPAPAPAAEG